MTTAHSKTLLDIVTTSSSLYAQLKDFGILHFERLHRFGPRWATQSEPIEIHARGGCQDQVELGDHYTDVSTITIFILSREILFSLANLPVPMARLNLVKTRISTGAGIQIVPDVPVIRTVSFALTATGKQDCLPTAHP
jgi:hypothetical protein